MWLLRSALAVASLLQHVLRSGDEQLLRSGDEQLLRSGDEQLLCSGPGVLRPGPHLLCSGCRDLRWRGCLRCWHGSGRWCGIDRSGSPAGSGPGSGPRSGTQARSLS